MIWCVLLLDAEFAHLLIEQSSVNAEQFGSFTFCSLALG